MTPRGVRFERDGAVGRIVLERPEAANALDLPAARALAGCVDEAAADGVRVITLTGEGARFCAGGDVASFAAAGQPAEHVRTLATEIEAQLRRLSALPKPVVAGVQGAVAGAGMALLLNADLVVAGRSTRFTLAYAGVGLTPDCGVSYLLPRTIGLTRAMALAVGGRVLSAEEAEAWGLVTEVVDDDRVAARTSELAVALAAGPARALGEARRLLRSSYDGTRDASAADEIDTIARMVTTDDAQRLIARFAAR